MATAADAAGLDATIAVAACIPMRIAWLEASGDACTECVHIPLRPAHVDAVNSGFFKCLLLR